MPIDYMTPFERHATSKTSKLDPIPEKESPYISTGYVRVPEAHDVMQKIKRHKRAPQPSPLLQEYLAKQAERKR